MSLTCCISPIFLFLLPDQLMPGWLRFLVSCDRMYDLSCMIRQGSDSRLPFPVLCPLTQTCKTCHWRCDVPGGIMKHNFAGIYIFLRIQWAERFHPINQTFLYPIWCSYTPWNYRGKYASTGEGALIWIAFLKLAFLKGVTSVLSIKSYVCS